MFVSLRSRLRRAVLSFRERGDREYEMGFNRIAFCILIAAYQFASSSEGSAAGLDYIAGYAVLSLLLLRSILVSGSQNERRRTLALVGDFVTISFEIHTAGSTSAVFSPLYLWVIFGNGFRFGLQYLSRAAWVANGTFLIMAIYTPFWRHNVGLTAGFSIGLIILPLYVSTLIKKLSLATEQAQSASKAKSMFLANVSHDLRTPLHTITTATMLLDDTPLDAEQKDLLSVLTSSSRHLLSLIGDILDLSSMEVNGRRLEPVPAVVGSMLLEAWNMGRIPAAERGVELRLQVDPAVPDAILVDRGIVQQILMNLLNNAIKFTSSGHITLAALPDRREGRIRFEVEDTGIGIEAEKLKSIFDSFVQADATIVDRYGGTGLGLSIAKQLVTCLDGQIGVDSKIGTGSVFWFSLPANPVPDVPIATADSKATMKKVSPLSVLVQGDYAEDLPQKLRAAGIEVIVLPTFDEAVARVELSRQTGRPAAMITSRSFDNQTRHAASEIRILRESGAIFFAGNKDEAPSARSEHGLRSWIHAGSSPAQLRAAFHVVDGLRSVSVAESAPEEPQARSLRVLVADDNRVNCRIMAAILQRGGHASVLAADGEEALDLLEREAFDVVLMDVNMPGLSGIEATKAYRFMEAYGVHVPIIALTADATLAMAARCREAGMDLVLNKPVEPAKVLSVIAGLALPGDVDQHATALKLPEKEAASFDVVLPVIDRVILKSLIELGGDDGEAFAANIYADFTVDAEALIPELRRAAEQDDLARFRDRGHAIKSSGLNIGAAALSEFAHMAEKMCPDDFGRDGLRIAARLEIELKRLQKEIGASGVVMRWDAESPG